MKRSCLFKLLYECFEAWSFGWVDFQWRNKNPFYAAHFRSKPLTGASKYPTTLTSAIPKSPSLFLELLSFKHSGHGWARCTLSVLFINLAASVFHTDSRPPTPPHTYMPRESRSGGQIPFTSERHNQTLWRPCDPPDVNETTLAGC